MLKDLPSDTDGKIHVQEEIKLLEFSSNIGKLESDVYDYSAAKLVVRNPVPIKDDRKKTIGFATVYLEGHTLKASCSIAADCPERLDIENGMNLYLHSMGYLAPNTDDSISASIDFASRKKQVVHVAIYALVLSSAKPKNGQSSILKDW